MDEVTKWSSEIVTAGVTALVFAIWKLAAAQFSARKRKRARTVPNAIESNHAIFSAINALANTSGASRVSVLRATNGGRLARAGQDLYTTLAFEVVGGGVSPAREGWQGQRLDESYIALLREVYHHGDGVWTPTRKLRAGILKTFCEATGVGTTYTIRIAATTGAFFYLAINFATEEQRRGDAIFAEAVRLAVSQIARSLRGDYDAFEAFGAED